MAVVRRGGAAVILQAHGVLQPDAQACAHLAEQLRRQPSQVSAVHVVLQGIEYRRREASK